VYERAAAIAPPKASVQDVESELRRVVVYVESTKLASKAERATMNQVGRRFEPEVLAVPAGSTVSFPNSDPIFHNVFSLSDTKPFDLGNYKQGNTRLVTFDRAGVVQVHCHLHANMSGAILVTPNAWLAQPASSGLYTLPPVPPGRYTVVAWHKTAGFFRREIDVAEGQAASVDFEIPVLESSSR
jgi:plastocyanin